MQFTYLSCQNTLGLMTPTMENHMKSNKEHEMETGFRVGFKIRGLISKPESLHFSRRTPRQAVNLRVL